MSDGNIFTNNSRHITARGKVLSPGSRALIMGVLNVTPDSFWDGGRYLERDAAVARACQMVEEGADLLDIGAESSRPGSEPVAIDEELRRLLPVLEAVCKKVTVPVSVDTTKAAVARRAIDAGAAIINDISALRFDSAMPDVIATTGAGVILMHMQGTPKAMQDNPRYENVVAEVREFLAERTRAAAQAGIVPEQILLDPGFGFGKTVDHNLTLLAHLDDLATLGPPLVVGASRKAFIGHVLRRDVDQRLMGTSAVVALAVERGARVVRVHDVGAMQDVVRMVEAVTLRSRSRSIMREASAEYSRRE